MHGGEIWLDSFIAELVLKLEGTENKQSWIEPLSCQELEILKLLVEGAANYQIADKLAIPLAVLKACVSNNFEKLSVDDRTHAAVQALRRCLI